MSKVESTCTGSSLSSDAVSGDLRSHRLRILVSGCHRREGDRSPCPCHDSHLLCGQWVPCYCQYGVLRGLGRHGHLGHHVLGHDRGHRGRHDHDHHIDRRHLGDRRIYHHMSVHHETHTHHRRSPCHLHFVGRILQDRMGLRWALQNRPTATTKASTETASATSATLESSLEAATEAAAASAASSSKASRATRARGHCSSIASATEATT
ncbi:hypothetical protein M431DRAFT_288471 [Trichoderma harzianum CBS 226.95]|uniref:Uncharacterized protein n=1 Tax=Trichoderma harzianum CBS 226.95 TaxID=983964 RepID=A0A2T4APB1_TRIHA|nr:hypothetical protein M431DRAFT_288471 [Trichoderma harzianum CBS 226.95]PTB58860.1 hypothetical protein M431DRAFT_288471 [Trichoderma harzianum CBS 226.95]